MIRKMGSFRTYVGLEEYELKQTTKTEADTLQPTFLNGELVISEAVNVLKFASVSKRKGLSGSLFVTNARVIFVSSDNHKVEEAVPLLSINTLWYYEHSKGSAGAKKHRHVVKLGPSSVNFPNIIPSATRVHEILIACSNFNTLRFSFKFSPLDHGLRICNAIIHHSFPLQLELLFYFDFSKATSGNWRQSPSQSTIKIPSYLEKGDWLKELNISRCNSGYRISNANENFELCSSLPEWVVVPADLIDVKLRSLAEKLKGCRPPHWSWADSKGGGILRMSKLNNENDSSAENAFFEVLRKTHPKKRPPEIFDLDKELPVKEIKQAFTKLFELCCPESYEQYEESDNKFYSILEQTKWLLFVSKTLTVVNSASDLIVSDSKLIILQEQESRDTACLCSSLIQVIVEARFRTITGFFSLIQKEWIAFGHPFHSAYMHTSPIFLMFLDCVHQLMLQNVVEFEFNDKLLAQIWNSCFESTRGTFLFDTPQQRKKMDRWNEYSAWEEILSDNRFEDLNESKTETAQSSFPSSFKGLLPRTLINPMYKLKTLLYPPNVSGNSFLSPPNLQCSSTMCDIQFWTNLYINRTLNTTLNMFQLIGGNNEIAVLGQNNSSTSTQTDSPEFRETSFVYSPNLSSKPKYFSMGRDPPGRELKLIEVLLAALSSSTRYRRAIKDSSSSASGLYDQSKVDGRRRRDDPFSKL